MPTVQLADALLNVIDAGDGPPLLLVHGFPLDHSMWQGQIDELSKQFRVIAPDLRGFGRSPSGATETTMEQFADDLAELLEVLQAPPVAYCGLSMGGYIGWQFQRRHGARLSHLIQCDTRAAADNDEARANRLRAAEEAASTGTQAMVEGMLPKLFAPATFDKQPQVIAATRRVMLAASPQAVAAAQRGMAARPDMTAALSEIDAPMLLVCGEHDAITPCTEMQAMAAAAPRARFVEIAGAGHMAPFESPAAVNAAITSFLRDA